MFDDVLTFVLLSPLWLAALVLLALGSRWRGLARPLWNDETTDGTVVAHESWRFPNGTERTGVVVDFVDGQGRPGRLVEPPVQWERPPEIGSTVRLSHRTDDLTFVKRYSRRRQALAWLATLVSMPFVVLTLRFFPLLMSAVVVPHVAWLAARRWNPPAAPVREATSQMIRSSPTIDLRAIPVPTSPPLLHDDGRIRGHSDAAHREAAVRRRAGVGELVDRHFFAVVSAGVISVVALVGASRSSIDYAAGIHLGLAAMLMVGVALFETSLAHRRGTVVTGTVVDHIHRRENEGDVYWLEVIEFESDRGVESFVDVAGPRRQRSVGSAATVSFRPTTPSRPRSLQRSQSFTGTALVATAVGCGIFATAPTWIPVLLQTAVCYVGYVVLDLVRGTVSKPVGLQTT